MAEERRSRGNELQWRLQNPTIAVFLFWAKSLERQPTLSIIMPFVFSESLLKLAFQTLEV